jgi:hypothetical protein
VEGYVAWALYTMLTKVVYICLLDYQNTVSCSNLFYLTWNQKEHYWPTIG